MLFTSAMFTWLSRCTANPLCSARVVKSHPCRNPVYFRLTRLHVTDINGSIITILFGTMRSVLPTEILSFSLRYCYIHWDETDDLQSLGFAHSDEQNIWTRDDNGNSQGRPLPPESWLLSGPDCCHFAEAIFARISLWRMRHWSRYLSHAKWVLYYLIQNLLDYDTTASGQTG